MEIVTFLVFVILITTIGRADDYVPSEILIKFNTAVLPYVNDGIVYTGIPEVDALNVRYGVFYFKQLFPGPSPEEFNSNEGRWSFDDLYIGWYERGLGNVYLFKFDISYDSVSVASDYNRLKPVDFAEENGIYKACYTPNDEEFFKQYYLQNKFGYSLQAESA